jgi:hypothetical protein
LEQVGDAPQTALNHDVMLRKTFFGRCSGCLRSAGVAWWTASHCPVDTVK